jgi:hypothetical protein
MLLLFLPLMLLQLLQGLRSNPSHSGHPPIFWRQNLNARRGHSSMSVHPLAVTVPALCSFLMKPLLLLLLLQLWVRHVLQDLRCNPSHSTPDILPSPGDKSWTRGMGTAACFVNLRPPARWSVTPH